MSNAPIAREVFANICLGGQNFDNPLDGTPQGIAISFLKHHCRFFVASLPPGPDNWACLMGLLISDLKTSTNLDLGEALTQAKHQLVEGGWSTRVRDAFGAAITNEVASSSAWLDMQTALATLG